LVWKVETDGAILGSLVEKDGTLYASLFSGQLAAFSSRDGDLIWEQSLDSWAWGGPLLDGDSLYVGDGVGNLYSYSLGGDFRWKETLNGAIASSPIVVDGELAVGTDAGKVYFVSLDGKDTRSVTLEGQIFSPLLPAGAFLLASPTEGESTVIALEAGAETWSFTPGK